MQNLKVQLWSHLTGCSLCGEKETRLADDVRLLRGEGTGKAKKYEKLIPDWATESADTQGDKKSELNN